MMYECCSTCRHKYTLEKWDYYDVKNNGVPKTRQDGFLCMSFADEGLAVWMVGTNPEAEMCECYLPKGKLKCEKHT